MDIQALRQELETRRAELLRRARALDHDRRRDAPLPADFAEQAGELENLDVLFALDREGRQQLGMIGRALARMDEGDYETCVRCGNPIGEDRLQALPWADTCVRCANAA